MLWTDCHGRCYLCSPGKLTIGNLTVFVNYSRQFSRPINEISMQVNTIFSALAGAERVFTVMDAPAEEADMPDAVEMDDVKGGDDGACYIWI